MERKIGEIFEFGGEWYQCVKGMFCNFCAFDSSSCPTVYAKGRCNAKLRDDETDVIFKKLEKVGEPHFIKDEIFEGGKVYVQNFKVYEDFEGHNPICNDYIIYDWKNRIISIEIKQTKEDMEEKKQVHNAWMKEKEAQGFSYGKDYDKEKKKHPDMLPYNELKEEVKEYDRATVRAVLQAQKELQSKYNYNNLKSFDLEAAKAGKPVCTRDGRKARIICFDRRDKFSHIVALITNPDGREIIWGYEDSGACSNDNKDNDLMMLPEKKEGWVNIYALNTCYSSKEEAEAHIDQDYEHEYVRTVKIEWEE